MPNNFYAKYGKRWLDLILSVPILLVLSPVLLCIAAVIKISDPGPVFFIQKRVGQNFQVINLIKFRSMMVDADTRGSGVTKAGDPRVTKVGSWLRRYKLDELPQFINVVKGDISMVGPRPELEKYVNLFKSDYEKILRVKPGITDFAALYYRFEEDVLSTYADPDQAYITEILPVKIKLYQKYIAEMSMITDLKIIAGTVRRIFV